MHRYKHDVTKNRLFGRIQYGQATSIYGLMVRSLAWRLSQPGFDPSYGKLMSSLVLVAEWLEAWLGV